MKHLKLFFALFAMLALGVGNAWGADPSVGDVIFQEEFTVTAKTMANAYDFAGTTTWSGSTSGLSYVSSSTSSYMETQTAKPITSANFFFVKASESNLTMSGISIPSNTTAITVSFQSNKTIVKCTYSFDGTNFSTGATSESGVQTFDIDCTGKSRLYFKFSKIGTSSNARIDNVIVKVKSVTSGSGSTESDVSVTDEQLKWSATTATALKGADNNEFPTLTNALGLTVTYDSSNKDAATIAADGKITLLAPGITTISAIFAGGEVSGTKYAAKTVTYTLTVKQLVSCADIYNLADDATFVLKDFVVTYVNGKYTYIKDDTGYGLIYKDSYGLIAGDQVASGKFEGKRDSYNSLVEIIPTTAAVDLHATNGTAPEPELMATNPIAGDMNKYVKFENVSFASTAFSSKSINGTIEGQGSSIKFYDQFTTNKTFDTSKKYDVIGVVSMFNSVQVNFISAEEVAEPTLNLTTTPIDFGKVAINSTNESTLQLSGSLLTKDITLSVEGDSYFTVSANSITPSEGSVNETITITYKPTVEGTHTATLKITSDDVAEQTITLTGQAVQQHTVHFFVNGEEQTDLTKKVLSGNTLEELPTATSCDLLNYPTFAGWTSAEIDGTTDVKPTMLDLSTPITSDCNYYAVFEKATTSSGSTTSAIMQYTGGTTTNMEDGNNATIVGLDETLFNITSTKTASGTHVGLNKVNDIRLYANKNDGKGNILTISMLDGSSITKITLDIKQEANFVVKANGKSITGADNVYTIDYSSCSIQNTTTGATTQLHLNSVTIEYTTSTTTYEYITSCAVVVPTCEITYDYADGEGECTNDIVEEGAEYTLCATAPIKAGHTFLNWKDQHGTEYAAGATITSVTEDLTLTAQWQVNSYSVTWMSLGEEVLVNSTNYNTQPTKPATDPAYTCGTGKEFVGWTTQEIDGVGVPANLYTDEFPVVTEAITYYAVFAGKSAEASITTNTLTIAENLGQYGPGTMTDDQGATWNYYAGGSADLTVNLRNNSGEVSYLASPKFAGTVQSITAHIKNGSSSTRKVYLRSSAEASPSGGDLGETSIAGNNNSNVALVIADGKSFDQFYIQVSGGLQFKDIVVTSGVAAGAYVDFITSCDAVTASISVENITMEVGETKTITATVEPAEAEVTYAIKENAANAISLSGNTITALAEGTATITATVAEGATYLGNSVDFTVTVSPKAMSDEVVILAEYNGKWYAMSGGTTVDDKTLAAVAVTYVGGKLYNVADQASITWTRTKTGEQVTFKNGENYLSGTSNNVDLELSTTACYWEYTGGAYMIGTRTFLYREQANGFRNYSNQKVGQEDYSGFAEVVVPQFAIGDAYGRTVTTGNFGTICIPYGSSNYKGAEFYEVAWVKMNEESMPTTLYLDQLEAGATLEAGKPYIFKATATEIAIIGDGTSVATPIAGKNGLTGTFENITATADGILVNNYIIAQNQFWTATAENYLNAYRAYIVPSSIPTTEPAEIPGRRRIAMGAAGENEATGLDNITTTDTPVKVIVNGQLIIIREGVKYNVQGVRL